MFGTLGGPELLLIFVIALIVFGPRKLPDIGKSVGKMMAEFRKASNDFKQTIESEVEAEKLREAVRVDPYAPSPSSPAPAALGPGDASAPDEGSATPSGEQANADPDGAEHRAAPDGDSRSTETSAPEPSNAPDEPPTVPRSVPSA
jgi:Tat protein translocase TatB subunit